MPAEPRPSPDERLFPNIGRRRAYEEVAEEIRRLIFERGLPPSHRLPTERDIAEQFGVSRMVVREAVRALERTGLVSVKKGARGGIFVAQDYNRPINDSVSNLLAGGGATLQNLSEVRMLVDPFAAARAAELGTEEEIAELSALVAQAELDRERGGDLRSANEAFHRHILRMSRNPVLSAVGEAVLGILSGHLRRVGNRAASEAALSNHRLILDAIRQRDPKKARRLMEKDLLMLADHWTRPA